jgi:hypothetical protein|nr:MAG TPA: hypothetical protein [Bacteriophage sp.]
MKKRDYNKLHKRMMSDIRIVNIRWNDKFITPAKRCFLIGYIWSKIEMLEFNNWCPSKDEEARDLFDFKAKRDYYDRQVKMQINEQYGKYKILGKADIECLAEYFYKMYVNYNEKCGAAKMLQELGYITDTQYLVLTDNFEQQCFERIPVAKSTFKSILQR